MAFTLNPANGDRSQVAIEAAWGLGPAVVAGEITPDSYLVDKVLFEITARRVSEKRTEHRLGAGGVDRHDVPAPRVAAPCLTDDEVRAVARLARRVERHYGCAQDIEWAIHGDGDPPASAVLLQARPETYWSRRRRAPLPHDRSPIEGIVSTLCAPLQERET